jgi:ABC-type sugar transport system permease subunit
VGKLPVGFEIVSLLDSLKRSSRTFTNVGLQLVLGIIFSLVLHLELKGRNLARGLILFPYLIPAIVAAIVWRFMLNPTFGVINYLLLDVFHLIHKPFMWLARPESACWRIMVGAWKSVFRGDPFWPGKPFHRIV